MGARYTDAIVLEYWEEGSLKHALQSLILDLDVKKIEPVKIEQIHTTYSSYEGWKVRVELSDWVERADDDKTG